MQHQDISKLCADSLRSYLSDQYSIKLKSGHAHEIAAAFLGYGSRIAMLADGKYPVSNLTAAKFIVLELPIAFVEQRLKNLVGLPDGFPACPILAKVIYSTIRSNPMFEKKVYSDLRELAMSIADERLSESMRVFGIGPQSFSWIKDVTVQKSEAETLMTVQYGYQTSAGETHRQSKYDIRLPRIAANLGYGEPEVHQTSYTGLARTRSNEELDKMYPTRLYPTGA